MPVTPTGAIVLVGLAAFVRPDQQYGHFFLFLRRSRVSQTMMIWRIERINATATDAAAGTITSTMSWDKTAP